MITIYIAHLDKTDISTAYQAFSVYNLHNDPVDRFFRTQD